MALKLDHVFGATGLQTISFALRQPKVDPVFKDWGANADHSPEPAAGDELAMRRRRIWDFGNNLHCSIVGTCLSMSELRHILEKLKVDGVVGASDHDVHCLGVRLASRRDGEAKHLQKALDRQHRSAITRYGKSKDPEALLEFWDESLKNGDIPGAYWAVLTHPAATKATVKRAFADVHMLSHLVGAANRADIRRLRQLELDNATLSARVQRQQRHLQDGFASRDRTISELHQLVARQADQLRERHLDAKHEHEGCLESTVENLS